VRRSGQVSLAPRTRQPSAFRESGAAAASLHIRDEPHLDEALEVLSELLRQDRDVGAQEYVDVLTDLIAAYEDEHVPIADVAEADVLREL
jgi:antitoxin component HigA of HigAB toxin-antitoxin module